MIGTSAVAKVSLRLGRGDFFLSFGFVKRFRSLILSDFVCLGRLPSVVKILEYTSFSYN